jgi:enamine deaminase RidA (YjgF/YER057c/UK114 family)
MTGVEYERLAELGRAQFTEIPQVINGASDLFLGVFGGRGPHARTAIGVQNLPLGFAVEVDMAVQLG